MQPTMEGCASKELRWHWQSELRRWRHEMQIHLKDHDDAANGTWPQVTMACDHRGGDYCQYLQARIDTAHEELSKLGD